MRTVSISTLAALALLGATLGGCQKKEQTTTTRSTTTTTTAPSGPAAPATPAGGTAVAPAPGGKVIEVKMVTTQGGAAGVFEPNVVRAKRGDVVRFVAADRMAAHNVEFPAADNPGKTNLPPASPYLSQAGQTWDLKVELEPGTYNFHCTPHAAMGMKGQLIVEP